MLFKASLDKLAKWVTVLTGALFSGILVLEFLNASTIGIITMMIVLGSIFLITYLFHPKSYEWTEEQLIIHRPIKNVLIERRNIRSVTTIAKDEMNGVFRVFGVGGLFGYYGKYTTSNFGMITWYATKYKKDLVLLTMIDSKKVLITPDKVELFVGNFN